MCLPDVSSMILSQQRNANLLFNWLFHKGFLRYRCVCTDIYHDIYATVPRLLSVGGQGPITRSVRTPLAKASLGKIPNRAVAFSSGTLFHGFLNHELKNVIVDEIRLATCSQHLLFQDNHHRDYPAPLKCS